VKRLLGAALLLALGAAAAADPLLGVREMALARVARARALMADPVLRQALVAQNAAPLTPQQLLRRDREWISDPQLPLRKTVTGSECARRLRQLTQPDAVIVEAILMDAQGANVCATRETSDYWQGDEAKFQRTFVERKPVFVDEPALDESAQTYAVQLSLLIEDGPARLGALTLTLRIPRSELVARKP
jgi:hypothetical protein